MKSVIASNFEANLESIGFNRTYDQRYMLMVLGEYSYIFAYYDQSEKLFKLRGSLTFPKEYNTVPLDDNYDSQADILKRIADITSNMIVK